MSNNVVVHATHIVDSGAATEAVIRELSLLRLGSMRIVRIRIFPGEIVLVGVRI